MSVIRLIGLLIGVSAMALAWILFSWKLTLVLMLALWANNIENNHSK